MLAALLKLITPQLPVMLMWKCKLLSILLLWSTSCLVLTPDGAPNNALLLLILVAEQQALQTSKERGAEVQQRALAGWMDMKMGHMVLLSGSSPALLFNTCIVGRCHSLITSAPTVFSYGKRENGLLLARLLLRRHLCVGVGSHKYPHYA